jgi:hypothetical protein
MQPQSPEVSTLGIEAEGLYVFQASETDLSRVLDPRRNPAWDALIPFSAVLRNASPQGLIAFSLRWHCDSDSGVHLTPEVTQFDFFRPSPQVVLSPSEATLASLLVGLGTEHEPDSRFDEEADVHLRFFQKQRSVRIVLEAALFEDGRAVGPDGSHWIERWRACLDAVNAVFGGAERPTRARLHALIARGVDSDPSFPEFFDSEPFLLKAHQATSYETAYPLYCGFYAARLLDEMDQQGDSRVLAYLNEHWASHKHVHVRRT